MYSPIFLIGITVEYITALGVGYDTDVLVIRSVPRPTCAVYFFYAADTAG